MNEGYVFDFIELKVIRNDIIYGVITGPISYSMTKKYHPNGTIYNFIDGEASHITLPIWAHEIYNNEDVSQSLFDIEILHNSKKTNRLKNIYIISNTGVMYLTKNWAIIENFKFRSF